MRDPERIDNITQKINEIWHHYPDLRFWQLLSCIDWEKSGDLFYLEDSKVEEILDRTRKDGI